MEREQVIPKLEVEATLEPMALRSVFRGIDEADAIEEVPERFLREVMSLLVANTGAVVDRSGQVRFAIPTGAVPTLPLADPALWECPVGEPTLFKDEAGAPQVVLRLAQADQTELALVVAFPGHSPLAQDRLSALPLLASYAELKRQYLLARQEADERKAQAEDAHAQQVEMALKLYDLYEEAQTQAITDGLTGLATHDFFQQRLFEELKESQRYKKPLTFIIFDLDHFKSINDTYGHQAGDLVLKETAAMLKASLRTTDLVARYGGEEFAVILPHTPGEEAYHLAERLRRDLEDKQIPINEKRSIRVTASIGVAALTEADVMPKDLIKRADVALYAAKNGGRNRVVMAQGPVMEAVSAIGAPRAGSQEMFFGLARALSAAIEARMPMMHGHSETVGQLAAKMAAAIGLGPDKQEAMMIAGLLHDVGMMKVPESVIFKPGTLSDKEWGFIKDHPAAGVAILARFSTFSGLLEAVLYHHERFDGKGYPEGLSGTTIPMGARILAICDCYDALVRGDYVFGLGVPVREARDEIGRCAGSQFDPELVEIFLRVIEEDDPLEQL